jgi:SPP1 gp7 family putative phage head morphogenesis protein
MSKKKRVRHIDPTRTGLLRRKFLADINKRLAKIVVALRKLLIEDDAFGLAKRKPLVIHATPGQYAFTTDANKLQAFNQWLTDQVNAGILFVSGQGVAGQPWTYEYVESAYKQGVDRAYLDTNKKTLTKSADFYAGSQAEFLRSSFMLPTTLSMLELLSLRTYDQLKGISATMSQQLSRIMSMGLASGWGPTKVAREMQKSIASLSRTRARMIARTEIIYAHAEGQLDSFDLLGIKELGIMAEWSTAGDSLVCPRCGAMEGKTFTVDEARGLIPKHPNCRCCWIPSEENT